MEVSYMNFMFYAVFNFYFCNYLFHFARQLGIKSSKFFSHFFKPDRNSNWPEGYIRFLDDFRDAIESELHDTREEMVASAKKIFKANVRIDTPQEIKYFKSGGILQYVLKQIAY